MKAAKSGRRVYFKLLSPVSLLSSTALEPDYSLLKRMLLARFNGETVSIEEIDRYVLEETPFRVAGYKEKVLVPMEDASEISIIAGSKKRRRHTYPKGV